MSSKPESGEAPAASEPESSSLFSSILGASTTQKAWGFWESAQKQAHDAWSNVDSDAIKQKLTEIGKTATEYIDEADRRIEVMENDAVTFIKHSSSEIVEKVKEATAANPGDGVAGSDESEVLFNGPERKALSRLDSELMVLNGSPLKILESIKTADALSTEEQDQLLKDSAELKETYNSLVPAKLSKEEFWGRYTALRADLMSQDERRKKLIGKPGQQTEEDDLDDWGSSGEE